MEVRDLQREVVLTERCAELGKIVLGLNEQLAISKKRIEDLEAQTADQQKS